MENFELETGEEGLYQSIYPRLSRQIHTFFLHTNIFQRFEIWSINIDIYLSPMINKVHTYISNTFLKFVNSFSVMKSGQRGWVHPDTVSRLRDMIGNVLKEYIGWKSTQNLHVMSAYINARLRLSAGPSYTLINLFPRLFHARYLKFDSKTIRQSDIWHLFLSLCAKQFYHHAKSKYGSTTIAHKYTF